MTTTRKQHSPQFKARVVIEAIPRREDAQPTGSQFKVHPCRLRSGGSGPGADAGLSWMAGHVNEQRRGGQQALYEEESAG